MPVLIHTNPGSSLEVERVEGSREEVVLRPFKPSGLRYPVIVGSRVLGWPLFCVSVSVEEGLSFLTLAVPVLDHKSRSIDVRLDGFPRSSGQDPWLSSNVYFSVGMVSVTFSEETVVVMRADPEFDQQSQEAIQISAMVETDGTLCLASHCAAHLPNWSIVEDEASGHGTFLRVAWRRGERPRVRIRPDLFPEPVGRGSNAEALVAAIPAPRGEDLAICYAGKAGWLSKVIQANREMNRPEEPRRRRTS